MASFIKLLLYLFSLKYYSFVCDLFYRYLTNTIFCPSFNYFQTILIWPLIYLFSQSGHSFCYFLTYFSHFLFLSQIPYFVIISIFFLLLAKYLKLFHFLILQYFFIFYIIFIICKAFCSSSSTNYIVLPSFCLPIGGWLPKLIIFLFCHKFTYFEVFSIILQKILFSLFCQNILIFNSFFTFFI